MRKIQKADNRGFPVRDNIIFFKLPYGSREELQINSEKQIKAMINADKLHKWKGFQRLNISIADMWSEQVLVPFADFIVSRLRDVQSFKLICNDYRSINGGVVEQFVQRITKHMGHLTEFQLIFSYQREIKDPHVKSIIRQIVRNLPYLELLTIRFDGCPYVTKESFDAFGYYTRRNLPRVKKLNLSFGEKNIPHFKFNFDTLFPSLQSLHLNLSYCSNTTDKDLTIFASNVLTKLHSIEEMILQLRCFWTITDKGMQGFSSYLSQNPTLKRLKIDFYGWRAITDEGLNSFAKEICRKSVNLKDFNVQFGDCYLLADSGIVSLAEEIGTHLKSLEKLHLDFSRSPHQEIHTSDNSIRTVAAAISQHSKSLKSIELSFSGCHKVTTKGLEYLIQQITKNIKKLEYVRLYFRRCPLISEECIEQIKNKFAAHPNVDFKIEWSIDFNDKMLNQQQ